MTNLQHTYFTDSPHCMDSSKGPAVRPKNLALAPLETLCSTPFLKKTKTRESQTKFHHLQTFTF